MALTYVGGTTTGWVGATSGTNAVSLTSLTGGSSTQPAAGDIVIAAYFVGGDGDESLTITDGTNNYTLISTEMYVAGTTTYDANLRVAYKIMGATPDTQVVFGPTGATTDAGTVAIQVWRGIDAATPIDVTPTEASATGTTKVNPAAITPVTAGAIIIAVGGAGYGTMSTYTSSDLSNFLSTRTNDNIDSSIGMGSYAWTSGSFDPAVWTNTVTTNSDQTYAAITLALRPDVPKPGTASLTISGQAPTALIPVSHSPAAAAVTVTGQAPTLGILAPVILSETANITAGGATATTAQLTPPSGKTTGDFQAGAISDDTNPLAGIDLAADSYTELEWAVEFTDVAIDAAQYEFRVTDAGTPIAYSQTPKLTVGISAIVIPVDAASVTITGQAPTANQSYTARPSAATATITGQAPTANQSYVISPSAASVTITGQAPAALQNYAVKPSTGAATITGNAPLVLVGYNIAVPFRQMGVGGYYDPDYIDEGYVVDTAPTLDFGFGSSSGTATVTGQTPSILRSISMPVGSGSLTVTGQEPASISGASKVFQPDAYNSVITGYAPVANISYAISTGVGSLVISGALPTTALNQTVRPDSGNVTITGQAPVVTSSTITLPPAGAVTITGQTPVVNRSYTISPTTGAVTITGQDPTVLAGASKIAQPAAGSAVITGYAPVVNQSYVITPAAYDLNITGLVPVSQLANTIIPIDTASLTITGYAPSLVQQSSAISITGTWIVEQESTKFIVEQRAVKWYIRR